MAHHWWILTPIRVTPLAIILIVSLIGGTSFALGYYSVHAEDCPERHRRTRAVKMAVVNGILVLVCMSVLAVTLSYLLHVLGNGFRP